MSLISARIVARLYKPTANLLHPSKSRIQVASISGRILRDRSYEKPAPFPYKEKHLSRLRAWCENPCKWFDENTKLIVVEGNIGSGKSSFAKKLAEDLEMLYVPEATMDMFYVNDYGYDFRQLDSELPPELWSYDVKNYYKNPKDGRAARFQLMMYKNRFTQYVDALAHMFNTGQGVVLERCAYSDKVFAEVMNKYKFFSDRAKRYYYELRDNTITELMRPHLVIYLDAPVDVLMERIKERGNTHEVNSSIMTLDYLKAIETEYKEYLKTINLHAELLFYDWRNYGDIEVVVEDIERIDFEKYDKYDEKMRDWILFDYWDYVEKRYLYTAQKYSVLANFNIPCFDVPELLNDQEDIKKFWKLWDNAKGNKYVKGYNADAGDKGLLFKLKSVPRAPF